MTSKHVKTPGYESKKPLKWLFLSLKSILIALVAATAWVEYTDLKEMSAQPSQTTS